MSTRFSFTARQCGLKGSTACSATSTSVASNLSSLSSFSSCGDLESMSFVMQRRYSDEFHSEEQGLERFFEACASRGREGSAVEAMDKGSVSANSRGVFGDSALHYAAHSGNVTGLKCLVAHGSDVNARNHLQVTPLGKAVVEGQLAAVRYLLSAGADIEAADDVSGTPLMAAARRSRTDVAQVLLDAGARVDGTDSFGNTALHLAAAEGHLSMLALLLKRGAAARRANARGQTPADIAVASWTDNLTKDKMLHMLRDAGDEDCSSSGARDSPEA
eukprot:TRINITY_DN3282_c0_g1_i1.p1 TRINITY_DN3282_c0_g1~~TRINITY_DN3282_c0_g1_i1.p1  ORF type:complete len:275 (-),score=104.84 TRINITY_DN3282_c0_g1_i1:137-961(-)